MNRTFTQVADAGLTHIYMSEALKDRVRARMRGNRVGQAGLPLGLSLRVVLAITLLGATLTAFALTNGFGLFELMGTVAPHMATVRPEAQQLVQTDLAFHAFPHVDVAIREAAYDGRYLRVAYSVTDRAATQPLDAPGVSLTEGRPQLFDFAAAQQDGISWSTLDSALVNGQRVNPLGMSFSVAGPGNGEAITWVQFDVKDLELPETFPVHLPLQGRDTPDALAFTLHKGDMRSVYPLALPEDKAMDGYTLHVQEVTVSPIRTYITLHLVVQPGRTVADAWHLATLWAHNAVLSAQDGSDPQRWTDTALGPVANMQWTRVQLQDGTYGYENRILNPGEPVTMAVYGEFTPPDTYPEAFWLGVDDEQFILIPMTPREAP